MELSRRRFLQMLSAAGVSASSASWLLDRVEALQEDGALPSAPGPGEESWLPTACGICQGGCGLLVRRIDGIPVGVRGNPGHPVNKGKLCPAAHASVQMLYSPDRVRQPLLRTGRRRHPVWEEISWEEAESAIVKRIDSLLKKDMANRIAFLDGRRAGLGRDIAHVFLLGLGSSNYVSTHETPENAIATEMFGWKRAPGFDLENALVIGMFGFDGFGTDGAPVWQSQVYAHSRERTIDRPIYISVTPRLLGSAAKADHWLPARPGTEGIVALAMANQILTDGRENRAFLEQHTDWYNDSSRTLRQLVREITPAVASDITGVPGDRIVSMARIFADHSPAVALAGQGSPGRTMATMTHVAVNLLNLVTGSLGSPGGATERPLAPVTAVWEFKSGIDAARSAAGSAARLADLEKALAPNHPSRIELLFVRDAHPVFESGRADAFEKALVDMKGLVVAFATEINETAMLADLILPEPTFLERWDLLTDTPVFPRSHVSLQQPALSPLFESRQSEEVLASVNTALGTKSSVSFKASSAEKLVRAATAGLYADKRGGSCDATRDGDDTSASSSSRAFWSDLKRDSVWALKSALVKPARPLKRIVTTPRAALNLEGSVGTDKLRSLTLPVPKGDWHVYPYQLVTFRVPELRNGETTNYPIMMELGGHWGDAIWDTWIELHPRTAAEATVENGSRVRVVSELGQIDAVARVTEAIPPGVVAIPVGLGHRVGSTAAGVGSNPNTIVENNITNGVTLAIETVSRVKMEAL